MASTKVFYPKTLKEKQFFTFNQLNSLPVSPARFQTLGDMVNIHFLPKGVALQIFKVNNPKGKEIHVISYYNQEKVGETVILKGYTLGLNLYTAEVWGIKPWKKIYKTDPIRAALVRWKLAKDAIVKVTNNEKKPFSVVAFTKPALDKEEGLMRGEKIGYQDKYGVCLERLFIRKGKQASAPYKFFIIDTATDEEVFEFISNAFLKKDSVPEECPFKTSTKSH